MEKWTFERERKRLLKLEAAKLEAAKLEAAKLELPKLEPAKRDFLDELALMPDAELDPTMRGLASYYPPKPEVKARPKPEPEPELPKHQAPKHEVPKQKPRLRFGR